MTRALLLVLFILMITPGIQGQETDNQPADSITSDQNTDDQLKESAEEGAAQPSGMDDTSQMTTDEQSALASPMPPVLPPVEKKGLVSYSFYSKNFANIYFNYVAVKNPRFPDASSTPDNFQLLGSQTGGEVSYKEYTAGVRENILVFFNKSCASDQHIDNCLYRYSNELFNHGWYYWVDRLYLKGDWKKITVTAGDFYESMNRGLMYSFADDLIYGDNSVRGADINFKWKGFHGKAFGGYANPEIRDLTTYQRMDVPHDWVWGAEFGYKFKKIDFGIEYAGGLYDRDNITAEPDDSPFQTELWKVFHIVGGFVKMTSLIPKFDIYLGTTFIPFGKTKIFTVASKDSRDIDAAAKDFSNANTQYISLIKWFDFNKDRLTVTLEMKRYDSYFVNYDKMESPDFTRRYFNPPSLSWNELMPLNEFDTWAGKGRLTFADNTVSGATYFAEASGGRTLNHSDKFFGVYDQEDFFMVGAGIERNWPSVYFSLKSGYLHSQNAQSSLKYLRQWSYTHAIVGGNIGAFSLKFTGNYWYRNDLLSEYFDSSQGDLYLDLSWKSYVTLSPMLTIFKNNDSETDDPETNKLALFPGIKVQCKYKILRFSIFYGKTRGGMDCSGGICRYVPDFDGIKTELDIEL